MGSTTRKRVFAAGGLALSAGMFCHATIDHVFPHAPRLDGVLALRVEENDDNNAHYITLISVPIGTVRVLDRVGNSSIDLGFNSGAGGSSLPIGGCDAGDWSSSYRRDFKEGMRCATLRVSGFARRGPARISGTGYDTDGNETASWTVSLGTPQGSDWFLARAPRSARIIHDSYKRTIDEVQRSVREFLCKIPGGPKAYRAVDDAKENFTDAVLGE